MRIFSAFFAIVLSVSGFASSTIEEIYDNFPKVSNFEDQGEDESNIIYQYLMTELANCDEDLLKKNPEIVFQKGIAGLDAAYNIEDHIEFRDRILSIKNDFRFVLENSALHSRLNSAAKLKYEFANILKDFDISDLSSCYDLYIDFMDSQLQKFSSDPSLKGRDLREEVFKNIQNDPLIKEAFHDFIILLQDDIDVVLLRVVPEDFEVKGVSLDENGNYLLEYSLKYSNSDQTYNMTIIEAL